MLTASFQTDREVGGSLGVNTTGLFEFEVQPERKLSVVGGEMNEDRIP